MQARRPSLVGLEQRLGGLLHSLDSQSIAIKHEPVEIDPSLPRYVCGECAWTTSKSKGLAIHFTSQHNALNFRCPVRDCRIRYSSQWDVDKHFQNQHAIPCPYPGCEEVFLGTSQLHSHLGENHPPGDDLSPEDGTVDTSRLFQCPYSGCGGRFPDHTALFNHYDGLHPLSIYQSGSPKPYKCPFCFKRYRKERYMKAHQRTNHRQSRWAPPDLDGSNRDQQALIQESHESIVGKPSQAPSDSSGSDEIQDEEEEYSITIADGKVYIDDELVLSSPDTENFEMATSALSAPAQAPINTNKRMAIGYILQPLPTERSTLRDTEDDYPERLALEEAELPRQPYHSSSNYVVDQFAHPDQGRRILHQFLYLLHLHQWISVGELMDLWSTLLTSEHRIMILQQLQNIDLGENERQMLSILHGSVLSELINAWAQFKLLPLQHFPQNFPRNSLAKEIISAILGCCRGLEDLVDEGRQIAIAQGFKIPELVRRPPRDESSISGNASLTRLIEALADRVKCRTAHKRFVEFTNVMILRETGPYIEDLKTVVRAIYPSGVHDGYR